MLRYNTASIFICIADQNQCLERNKVKMRLNGVAGSMNTPATRRAVLDAAPAFAVAAHFSAIAERFETQNARRASEV